MKIERVQTGLRLEKRILKVVKGLAEHLDMSAAEVVEGVLLHAFEGKAPFSAETLDAIAAFKTLYGCELAALDSHRLEEVNDDAT